MKTIKIFQIKIKIRNSKKLNNVFFKGRKSINKFKMERFNFQWQKSNLPTLINFIELQL